MFGNRVGREKGERERRTDRDRDRETEKEKQPSLIGKAVRFDATFGHCRLIFSCLFRKLYRHSRFGFSSVLFLSLMIFELIKQKQKTTTKKTINNNNNNNNNSKTC